jgi:hypothetical protein
LLEELMGALVFEDSLTISSRTASLFLEEALFDALLDCDCWVRLLEVDKEQDRGILEEGLRD